MKPHPFSEVVTDVTAKFTKIKASDYQGQGRYKIIDQGKGPVAGYTDDASLVNGRLLPVVVFGDHTRALKYVDEPIALGADGAKALWVNSDLANPRYVYYYLRSIQIKEAGYSRHFKFLREIEIPIPFKDGAPNFDDQIRIAHLLGKVEGLIAQRKQHLQQLDDLLKSVFLEMFGDPVRNEMGWETGTSSVYAGLVTVGVVVKPASHYVDHGVIALRSLNIKPNRIDLSDLVYFSRKSSDGLLSKSRLQANDVVIVRTGKTGTAAVVPAALDGANCIDLIVVRPKPAKIHPQFLTCLLNSERGMALVSSLEVGGIQKHFNVGALNKIPFPLPPIPLQGQFADVVEEVEAIKSSYQKSLTDLEALYGALSQQAFKGELDLSRVALPAAPIEGETAVAAAVPAPIITTLVIELPDTDLLLPALQDRTQLAPLLRSWLEAYRTQLGIAAFSLERFIAAAQSRLGELHPDNDFELGASDYEQIKTWVFEALSTGSLVQAINVSHYDETTGEAVSGNMIELKANQP